MRKALWILSAPVVAGGLAWAVSAADEQPLRSRAPSTQTGKVVYFSRGAAATADTASAKSRGSLASDDEAADETSAESATPQRYVRNRSNVAAASGARPKGRYQDLFGDGSSETRQPATETRPVAAASRKPAANAAQKPQQRKLIEDTGLNETSPDASENSHEDTLLPPSDDLLQLIQGAADKEKVQHADHKTPAGSRGAVKQVQNVTKGASKGRARPADEFDDAIADLESEDSDWVAPPPTATAKTVKPVAKKPTTPPAAAARTAQAPAARTSKSAPPVAAAKPRATRKVEPIADSATEAPAVQAPIQQTSAIANDVSETPLISLKWVKNTEVNVDQECTCGLLVKNTGKLAARDILVEAYFPETVRLLDAKPLPQDTKKHLTWLFDKLDPGEEKTIEITMLPGRAGELATSATVRFTGVASTVLHVDEPQLNVAIEGPHEVTVGESLTQEIIVSNPGTGVARDVVVHAIVPEGLKHQKGKSVELAIGSVGPGESRTVRLPLVAAVGGESILRIEARGGNLVRKTQTQIKIAAPKLKVEVAGPALRYINRHAQYTITVTNDGVAATDNVQIVHLIPEGFEFVKADRGGKYDSVTACTTWFVGRLEAGQSIQVACDLNARQSGDYQHHVQASGENGTPVAAKIETKIDGASAVVMEVVDLDDPVEVGTQTAYEITIRNTGSKASQNLRLACELPQGVELLDTEGPTAHGLEKGFLIFRPIAELAAGGKIVYRIKVNGKTAGNLRLRALLTTGSSKEPLVVEELTKFYAGD